MARDRDFGALFAPRSVAVQRAELLKELEESNRASASPSEDAVASLSRQLGGRAAR